MAAITELDPSARRPRRWLRDAVMIALGAVLTVALLGMWDLSTRDSAQGATYQGRA